MLNKAYQSVREFHLAFGHPAPNHPATIPIERVAARADWITEEADESRDAALEAEPLEQIVGVADAYIDSIYFGLGGLVELGINPDPLFEIVHAANMAKRHLINGELVVVTRADGKVVKPEGWIAPEPLLRAEVMRQVHAATTPVINIANETSQAGEQAYNRAVTACPIDSNLMPAWVDLSPESREKWELVANR